MQPHHQQHQQQQQQQQLQPQKLFHTIQEYQQQQQQQQHYDLHQNNIASAFNINNNNNNNNNTTSTTTSASIMDSSNDTFVNSLIQELRTIKLSNNYTNLLNSSLDGVMPMLGESSIMNNNNNKQNANNINNSIYTKSTSLWDAPHSPTCSNKTQYHSASSHSNSKESLWASTQSSPNSTHRKQLKQISPSSTSSTTSSTSVLSLWDNPNSKMSQASLMMSKTDSYGGSTIWHTPPQIQSPIFGKIGMWDNAFTASTGLNYNNNKGDQSTIGPALIRPQDLASPTISNNQWNGNATTTNVNMNKTKDTVSSLWATPTSAATYNKLNSMMITSTPIKPASANLNAIKSTVSMNQSNDVMQLSNNNNGNQNLLHQMNGNGNIAPASSSCLQLFSDEFINYLNMIN